MLALFSLLFLTYIIVREEEGFLLTNHIQFLGVSIRWPFHWLISVHVYQHDEANREYQPLGDVEEMNRIENESMNRVCGHESEEVERENA